VQDHQKLLGLIDSEIKPAATSNDQLTKALDSDRAKIEKHLAHAQKLQAKM
jgi:hypothetical protein